MQFLSREVNYSQQLYSSLDQVQHVRRLLAEVKEKMNDRRMLDSIRLLEGEPLSRLQAVGLMCSVTER